MKIALVGASGNIGAKILDEALARGHKVTAIVRDTSRLPKHAALTAKQGDLASPDTADLLKGHDVVIAAVPFSVAEPDAVIATAKAARAKRLVVVGGAGSLLTEAGTRVVDQPDFPAAWKDPALKGAAWLERFRAEQDLDWTYFSPAALIEPGRRTGRFRLGHDHLLVGADGQSRISQEDYAVAMLDEVETPRHRRARFTIAY